MLVLTCRGSFGSWSWVSGREQWRSGVVGGKEVARLGEATSKEELVVRDDICVTYSLFWRSSLGNECLFWPLGVIGFLYRSQRKIYFLRHSSGYIDAAGMHTACSVRHCWVMLKFQYWHPFSKWSWTFVLGACLKSLQPVLCKPVEARLVPQGIAAHPCRLMKVTEKLSCHMGAL